MMHQTLPCRAKLKIGKWIATGSGTQRCKWVWCIEVIVPDCWHVKINAPHCMHVGFNIPQHVHNLKHTHNRRYGQTLQRSKSHMTHSLKISKAWRKNMQKYPQAPPKTFRNQSCSGTMPITNLHRYPHKHYAQIIWWNVRGPPKKKCRK